MSPLVVMILVFFTISSVKLFRLSRRSCQEGYVSCEMGSVWRANSSQATCLKETSLCDGELDCTDGSDERFCTYNYNYGVQGFAYKYVQGPCPDDYVLCPSGEHKYTQGRLVFLNDTRCIHRNWLCDAERDCLDLDDEAFCPYNQTTGFRYTFKQAGCPEGYYLCRNGTAVYSPHIVANKSCIKQAWICDGIKDCKDNSDESYCPYVLPLNNRTWAPTTTLTTSRDNVVTSEANRSAKPTSRTTTETTTSFGQRTPNEYAEQVKAIPSLHNLLVTFGVFVIFNSLLLIGLFIRIHIHKYSIFKNEQQSDMNLLYVPSSS